MQEWTTPDLATLIEMDRANLLARYGRAMETAEGPVATEPAALRRVAATADQVLTDVVESLRADRVRVAESYKIAASEEEDRKAADEPHPRESLVAGSTMFDMVLRKLIGHLRVDEESAQGVILAIVALHQSLMMRLSEEFIASSGRLLSDVHEAQTSERARIAREIHDRAGFWLNTASHQLELLDAAAEQSLISGREAERLKKVREAVGNVVHSLREVTSELRLQEPMKSLETALLIALSALSNDEVTLRVNINGDEAWAPHTVKDETFLIIREAVRNAVVHGRSRLVVVGVHIAPQELRVFIDDDGGGFDVARRGVSGGLGLSSMRERAELMNGTLTVSSVPGRGTHVELFVPLPGQDDA
ncbi:hypothetical protein DPM19_24130 [Actinomadura craniellae]|uniref:histidine kinase n=1 Tax=Actinomadura craniellae TaxID=2231787 RepID=A0A365H0S3_9ACTN|nr:ATP-binding protein [Actinomadura craniellae]RAY12685.1 hypothetical protein DPM19_24130 [Actinomadura craniellae]